MAATEKKLVKSKSGYRMVPVIDTHTSPFTISEPAWVPDTQCPHCNQCQGKFDFMNRRHHCRRCGKCFCDSCCSHKVRLQRMLFVDPVRHCKSCSNISQKESDFFEKYVKALLAGGTFHIVESEATDNSPVFTCRLSADHRYLNFENEHRRLDDILLTDIEAIQILQGEMDSEGNPTPAGLAMKYKDSCGEMQLLKMAVANQNKKEAQFWITSMLKAFKMVYSARTGATTPTTPTTP